MTIWISLYIAVGLFLSLPVLLTYRKEDGIFATTIAIIISVLLWPLCFVYFTLFDKR